MPDRAGPGHGRAAAHAEAPAPAGAARKGSRSARRRAAFREVRDARKHGQRRQEGGVTTGNPPETARTGGSPADGARGTASAAALPLGGRLGALSTRLRGPLTEARPPGVRGG